MTEEQLAKETDPERLREEIRTLRRFLNAAKANIDLALAQFPIDPQKNYRDMVESEPREGEDHA